MNIRQAFEQALAAMQPPLATAWENRAFTPTTGIPYQRVFLMLARPYGQTIAQDAHWLPGILQVDLMYPQGAGAAAAEARADMLEKEFKAGTEVIPGLRVLEPPERMGGTIEGDRYRVTVKIRFQQRKG